MLCKVSCFVHCVCCSTQTCVHKDDNVSMQESFSPLPSLQTHVPATIISQTLTSITWHPCLRLPGHVSNTPHNHLIPSHPPPSMTLMMMASNHPVVLVVSSFSPISPQQFRHSSYPFALNVLMVQNQAHRCMTDSNNSILSHYQPSVTLCGSPALKNW